MENGERRIELEMEVPLRVPVSARFGAFPGSNCLEKFT
jgi:hypothetical protein